VSCHGLSKREKRTCYYSIYNNKDGFLPFSTYMYKHTATDTVCFTRWTETKIFLFSSNNSPKTGIYILLSFFDLYFCTAQKKFYTDSAEFLYGQRRISIRTAQKFYTDSAKIPYGQREISVRTKQNPYHGKIYFTGKKMFLFTNKKIIYRTNKKIYQDEIKRISSNKIH
jgi:hypothetical protein